MAVEARLYVSNVGKRPKSGGGFIGEVSMHAATKGPNDWSEWTPTATFTLGTLNPKAMAWFDAMLGKDVRVLIDEAPEIE